MGILPKRKAALHRAALPGRKLLGHAGSAWEGRKELTRANWPQEQAFSEGVCIFAPGKPQWRELSLAYLCGAVFARPLFLRWGSEAGPNLLPRISALFGAVRRYAGRGRGLSMTGQRTGN